jgi:adenylate cyclase
VDRASNTARPFEEAGLLVGLDGGEREVRLALLGELVEQGFSLDELKRAAAENRLGLLPVDRVLGGDPRYTARQIAELSGVPLEHLQANRQAIGLAVPDPDDRTLNEQDLDAARVTARLREAGLPEEGLLDVTRVLGTGLAQGAEAMRMLVASWLLPQGVDERELSVRMVEAAHELLPLTAPLLQYMLTVHLRDQLRNQQFGGLELTEGMSPNVRQVYVGFSDMVGFTPLGERIEIDELGRLLGRLTDLGREAVQAPTRLIKSVGDALMFVSPSPTALLQTALSLTERVEAADGEIPPIRSGLAAGVAISREGDWYGPPVNLASRITDIALAGSALATRELREAAGDSFRWSYAGERRLKGFKRRVPLYRVRRAVPET